MIHVGVTLLTELLRPKPNLEGAKPASLGDFSFPTAQEGRAIPLIWGTVRLNGPNIIWYGDLRTEAITEKVKTGLFSSSRIVVGHKYFIGIDLGLCRGDFSAKSPDLDEGIRRIWMDDEVLRPQGAGFIQAGAFTIDEPNFFGEDSGGIVGTFTLHPGEIPQAANSYMAGLSEIDATLLPGYIGTAHLVMEQVFIGNSPNLRPIAMEVRRIPNTLGLTAPDVVVNGNDANPAAVIFEIMTDPEWGLGLTNVDTVQMKTVAAVLAAEGNGYARILDNPLLAVDLLQEIEQQIDGILTQDPITKNWQIRLVRETDFPSPLTLLPLFDESNILDLEFTRGSWADTTNQVKIQYQDFEKNFQTSFALAQDMANKIIQDNDDIIVTSIYPGVQNGALANELAWRDLRTLSYPIAKGKIKADRSNYAVLPGDLIRLTWPPFGITELAMRVNRVQLGTADGNEIVYDVVEDIFRTEVPSYSDPQDTLWIKPDQSPFGPGDARVVALPIGYQDTGDVQQYGLVAVRNNGLQLSYDVYIKESTSSNPPLSRIGYTLEQAQVPYTPSALLDGALDTVSGSPIDYTNDVIFFNNGVDIQSVDRTAVLADLDLLSGAENLVLIDEEIIFFETLTDLGGGDFRLNNVHRGMLDTAVVDHPDLTRMWFITYGIGLVTTILDPTTNGFNIFFMPNSTEGDAGAPDSGTFSPEVGFQAVQTVVNRFEGASAAINPKIDGARFPEIVTASNDFICSWFNRANASPFASPAGTNQGTQEDANEDPGPGITYTVRVFHTGVSPRVLVFTAASIPVFPSPDLGLGSYVQVNNFEVPFSPDVSPVPSPFPFARTYTLELESVKNGYVSELWSVDFEVQ